MEKKNAKLALVGFLVMAMFLGEAAAGFRSCYGRCYFTCILDMSKLIPFVPKKLLPCALKCLKKCIFHIGMEHDQNVAVLDAPAPPPVEQEEYSQYDYCKLGCSLDSCSDSFDDDGKMERCVDNCSSGICKALQ